VTVIVIVIIWAEYEMYVSTAGSPEFTRINGHKMSSCFCFAGHLHTFLSEFCICIGFYILGSYIFLSYSIWILMSEALCCRIRASTLERLYDLTDGALSQIMRRVTAEDPIAPLLAEHHFKVMDRRLAIVLHTIDGFVRESSAEAVLVTDGFS